MTKKNELLAHAIKAIKYRFTKAINNSKPDFGNFKISEHTRCPNEIINHMFDLANKTQTMIQAGHFNCPQPELLDFEGETSRFLLSLEALKTVLNQQEIALILSKKLLQGPILDITTHIGQIAMLNGLHGNKIPKESYYAVDLD